MGSLAEVIMYTERLAKRVIENVWRDLLRWRIISRVELKQIMFFEYKIKKK